MARNRTRLAKIKAAARRQSSGPVVIHSADQHAVPSQTPVQASHNLAQAMQSVFGYPVNLIYRDLLKTVLLTALIIVIIVGIALWRP